MTLFYTAIAQDLLNASSQGSQSTWSVYNPGKHGRRSLERRMNNSLEQNEKIVKANVKEDEVVLRARSEDIEEEAKKEKENEDEDEDEDEDEEDEDERREIKREKDFEGLPHGGNRGREWGWDRCWMHAESGTDVCVLLSISTWNLANRQLKTAYPSVLANILDSGTSPSL
ncbi:hypothetical protein V1477_009866 [Vespula maculifrons]|uniref:Uncharacterized protein n=1 Tax=Vespula maculifrons TaxID=7453 RepID=A0ABD2CB08_VESMC